MAPPAVEVAQIFRRYGEAYERRYGRLRAHPRRVVRDLITCRTQELGGHRYVCEACGVTTEHFNSCRNRHCPKCQHLERERWLEKRRAELLPVPYFHLVFTVPHELNPLCLTHPRRLYHLLFQAAAKALLEVAAERLKARLGFLAVLHTWGQQVELHPHLHILAPGGGLSLDGRRWVASPPEFFLPVKLLGARLRRELLAAIDLAAYRGERIFPHRLDPALAPSAFLAWRDDLERKAWNVYCKPPFAGAQGGAEYLARYSHRVAITNSRLLDLDHDQVSFRYKDYRDGGKVKVMSLDAVEFLRRFLLHILPVGFQRLRSYGLLANRQRAAHLKACRKVLGVAAPTEPPEAREAGADLPREETPANEIEHLTGLDPRRCPACGQRKMRLAEQLPARSRRTPPTSRAPPRCLQARCA